MLPLFPQFQLLSLMIREERKNKKERTKMQFSIMWSCFSVFFHFSFHVCFVLSHTEDNSICSVRNLRASIGGMRKKWNTTQIEWKKSTLGKTEKFLLSKWQRNVMEEFMNSLGGVWEWKCLYDNFTVAGGRLFVLRKCIKKSRERKKKNKKRHK